MEQQPQPIVLEVPLAVGEPAELLGGEVLGLAPGVGAPGREVAEDLGLPALDGPRQAPDLGGAGGPRQLLEGGELGVGLLVERDQVGADVDFSVICSARPF